MSSRGPVGKCRHKVTELSENFTLSHLFLCDLVPLWQMTGFRPGFLEIRLKSHDGFGMDVAH